MFDAVIVGGGPAGLSAALVLGRSRRRILLCDTGSQRNAVAAEMHGFLSRDGMPPLELLAEATKQLERYPTVAVSRRSVEQIEKTDDAFLIGFADHAVSARRIILTTGMIEDLPPIPGLLERWGQSVFSCPYCDGWEMRDRAIAIAGDGNDLVPLAQELYQWSRQLTICGVDSSQCNLDQQAWIRETGTSTFASPVASLSGDAALTVHLERGNSFLCDALFTCVPLVQRSHLASDLGCAMTSRGRIEVNVDQQTSVPGVYSAGDATSHVHQVVTAAAGGTVAGVSVNNDLCAEDVQRIVTAVAARSPV